MSPWQTTPGIVAERAPQAKLHAAQTVARNSGFRRFVCARCGRVCYLCPCCDRGNRYCTPVCAAAARKLSLRLAAARHRKTRLGALAAAARQSAYRARQAQKVTHQGSPQPPAAATIASVTAADRPPALAPSVIVCVRCGRREPNGLVRLDFVRRRGPLPYWGRGDPG